MTVGRIDSFWAQLNNEGIAKNSHWDVQINLPDSLLGRGLAGIERTLAFRCEAGEIPGRQLVTNDVKIYGPIYRTPYQSLYTELNLTFVETADMKVRRFMEIWMDSIFDSASNVLQYQNTYQTSMILTQYHTEARESLAPRPEAGDFATQAPTPSLPAGLEASLYIYLHRAYPININQMATAWSDDSPHRVQVTFFYEWYTMAPAPRSSANQSRGAQETNKSITVPMGLYDTAASWFTKTSKRFF